MSMTENERSALRAIEQNLMHTDPAFAARMRTADTTSRPGPVLSVLCAVTYICVPLEALLFGRYSAIVTLCLVAIAVTVVLIGRRRIRLGHDIAGRRT
jgi:hypothetical protein